MTGLNIADQRANTRATLIIVYLTVLDLKGIECKIDIMSFSSIIVHYRLSSKEFPSLVLHMLIVCYA